jgi:putative transposase
MPHQARLDAPGTLHHVGEEGCLLELVRDIHLNPLRSEAVQRIEELDGYPWSGHGVLMGRQKRGWRSGL